jgi:hypothetical protein
LRLATQLAHESGQRSGRDTAYVALSVAKIDHCRLLGHAAGNVTARYVHPLDSTIPAAVDRVAEHIRHALGKKITDTPCHGDGIVYIRE